MREPIEIGKDVAEALEAERPIVALESTVFSRLGLPHAAGAEALRRSIDLVVAAGAVPALTTILDGVCRVGVDEDAHPAVLGASRKAGERDLAVAVAQRWPAAGTTVSASVALAAVAGIEVFATGAIGGVHRDWAVSGDESADLAALAGHPVVTVCAGAKSFLDLRVTLERLETLGVPVLGLGTDELPAFYSRRSGVRLPHRVETVAEVADVVVAARRLGYTGGVLVCSPVPEADEVPFEVVAPIIEESLAEAAAAGVAGGAVTPFVLERVAQRTGGRTVAANIALVGDNARVAAEIAVALKDPAR